MYRQILIHPDDADYQRILWRATPTEPVASYKLLTVTYGVVTAPYLALRVLKQLISDEGAAFPLAIPVLEEQTYIDDSTFGSDDLKLTIQIRDQLIALLLRGGFKLHKWISNNPTLLSDINDSSSPLFSEKSIGPQEKVKILGISWSPDDDKFSYKIKSPTTDTLTKRTILSVIASLFDPLGWLAPVIIKAKIFMQQLWQLDLEWDDELPRNVQEDWLKYKSQLPLLESISIPRWTTYSVNSHSLELHGFCDASEKAYAAVVYSKLIDSTNDIKASLIAAKTRVAPLKFVTIPRLELCAALLITELMIYVREALKNLSPHFSYHCWSDSRVTLAWIDQSPTKWNTFVAHRVSKIQELGQDFKRHYVPTDQNPADCALRGIYPQDLIQNELWWSGPTWLTKQSTSWPQSCPKDFTSAEIEKRKIILSHNSKIKDSWSLKSRYSSWSKLIRVTAIIIRFVNCLKNKRRTQHTSHNSLEMIASDDVDRARVFWLKQIQADLFSREYALLTKEESIPQSSSLSSLCPYLDSLGILRVRGRLRFASLPEPRKHPIILGDHPLVRLLISNVHLRLLHAGPQLTLAHIRETYWILRARSLVRAVLYKCLSCARNRAQTAEQFMGDLPSVRVNVTDRAFRHTGIDYAGPILTRSSKGRGCKHVKSYIAVFICMTTKAIHLELVTDYSATAFVAAYKRFISRRGLPSALYSDNGTTFRGAERELAESYKAALRDPSFSSCLTMNQISWHFLPPAAPHFGGLWEAAVKSVKTHLKRCIGSHNLTYEELMTLLCCIEAVLNSRPISSISDCLDDYSVLTPGHFLIHGSLLAQPEPSVLELSDNRLSRWQLVQKMQEQF